MTDITTEAGKRLLADYFEAVEQAEARHLVAAIEAEAMGIAYAESGEAYQHGLRAERARLRERVERLPLADFRTTDPLYRAAVLAILEETDD